MIKKGLFMGLNADQKNDVEEKKSAKTEEKITEIIIPLPTLSDTHIHAATPSEPNIAMMHNFIARAVTRWSLEESKLFICALSQIRNHDENGWVKLSKKDLNKVLEYKNRSSKWLRRIIKNVAKNSWLHFESGVGWDDGFVINRTRSDRWNVYIRFEKDYLPLLEELTSHFTTVYVESIAKLNHKAGYSLYLYLKSWAKGSGEVSHRYILKKDIHSVFNLVEGSYIKNPNTDKQRFDWYNFEKYCLIPAIEDINKNEKGEIEIFEVKKMKKNKHSRFVDGYYFTFRSTNKYVESLSNPKAIEFKSERKKEKSNKLLRTDPLPTYEEIAELLMPIEANIPEVYKRLAEQHQKREIGDWKKYTTQIAVNLGKEKAYSKHPNDLPGWYTYVPTKQATPELRFRTFLSRCELSSEDPFLSVDEWVDKTGMSKEEVIYFMNNPQELDKIIENQD